MLRFPLIIKNERGGSFEVDGLFSGFLCLSACGTYNAHDFALTQKHLSLRFGLVAAVAMLFPCMHAAGEELYHPVLLQQTLRGFLAMNHKAPLLHSCSHLQPGHPSTHCAGSVCSLLPPQRLCWWQSPPTPCLENASEWHGACLPG